MISEISQIYAKRMPMTGNKDTNERDENVAHKKDVRLVS